MSLFFSFSLLKVYEKHISYNSCQMKLRTHFDKVTLLRVKIKSVWHIVTLISFWQELDWNTKKGQVSVIMK